MVRNNDELIIPEVPWSVVRSRLLQLWEVRDAPHHSVIGQTRSGKSYLTRYGILDTCRRDRVLIIDCKGDDKTLTGLGHIVNRFPNRAKRQYHRHQSDDPNERWWYRLVTSAKTDVAQRQVGEALQAAYDEGDWIVVVDETKYVTNTKEPNIALDAVWEQIVLRGGSRGVGLVNLTQEPRWVPGSFFTQSSFYWFSRVEDERAQERIAEVGSSRSLLGYLGKLPRRWWIYTDNLEDERWWGLTKVPARR